MPNLKLVQPQVQQGQSEYYVLADVKHIGDGEFGYEYGVSLYHRPCGQMVSEWDSEVETYPGDGHHLTEAQARGSVEEIMRAIETGGEAERKSWFEPLYTCNCGGRAA